MSARTAASPGSDVSWRVTFCLGGELMFYLLMWVGILTFFTVGSIVLSASFGDIDNSLAVNTAVVPRYALLAGGIMVVASQLPMYVSNGVTRRLFTRAALPVVIGWSVIAALSATAFVAIEDVVYNIADWPHVLSDPDDHLFDRPNEYGMLIAELSCVYAAHVLSGWLIGSAISRQGCAGGLLIVPAVIPAVIVEMVFASGVVGRAGNNIVDFDPSSLGLALAVSIAVIAVAALVARTAVRDIPVDNQGVVWWR